MFEDSSLTNLNLFCDNNNNVIDLESGLVDSGQEFVTGGVEYKQVRRWVVKTHSSYESWIE